MPVTNCLIAIVLAFVAVLVQGGEAFRYTEGRYGGGELRYINDVPVLVVARTALGTINHTLLTLHALRARKLDVMGVVMVGDCSPDNRAAIEEFGAVPVLGELPRLDELTARTLRKWALEALDPEGRLLS